MVKFYSFDKRRFSPKERKEIKKKKITVYNFPKSINKRNYLGYAVKDEITFEKKNQRTILLKKNLRGRELKRTFWHEVAHFNLRKRGMDKKLKKREREIYCERFARRRAG